MYVYLNYPVSKISMHCDPNCSTIQKGHKKDQRVIKVDEENANAVLQRFGNKHYKFWAESDCNDMWLDLRLSSRQAEYSFVESVKRELSRHYNPFRKAEITEHC